MSFATILSSLSAEKIEFVVVGGVAAAAHGASRVPRNLDIVYNSADNGNVAKLANLLAHWNAYPRGVEPGLPFLMDHHLFFGAPNLSLVTSEGDLNALSDLTGVGDYAALRTHSEEIQALGLKFRILDLPTLVKAKRAAGRPRDFEDLVELEALLALKSPKKSRRSPA